MQCNEEAFLIVFSLSSLSSLSIMSSIAPYALGQSVNNEVEIISVEDIPNNAIETVLDESAVFLNWVFDGTEECKNHNVLSIH